VTPYSSPPRWDPHPGDDLIIAGNVARLDAEIQGAQGSREEFTLAVPLAWHTRIHEGCTRVPINYYVGHYRGERYGHLLAHHVVFPPFTGAPAGEVALRLTRLEAQIRATLTRFDAEIAAPADATKPRLNKVIDDLAKHYAGWIRIHPFVDGNGRTARILANWVLARYWQPLILPGRPPADKKGLVEATAKAVPETGADYRPLGTHLRKRLWAARKAAMAAAPPSPQAP